MARRGRHLRLHVVLLDCDVQASLCPAADQRREAARGHHDVSVTAQPRVCPEVQLSAKSQKNCRYANVTAIIIAYFTEISQVIF